jgi:hypothetical protein
MLLRDDMIEQIQTQVHKLQMSDLLLVFNSINVQTDCLDEYLSWREINITIPRLVVQPTLDRSTDRDRISVDNSLNSHVFLILNQTVDH